jgi:plasmid stability protein
MQSLLALKARMASITIRRLDEKTKARLHVWPAQHGRSVEEEARSLLGLALRDDLPPASNLADAIRSRFRRLGGVDLQFPARGVARVDPWKP